MAQYIAKIITARPTVAITRVNSMDSAVATPSRILGHYDTSATEHAQLSMRANQAMKDGRQEVESANQTGTEIGTFLKDYSLAVRRLGAKACMDE